LAYTRRLLDHEQSLLFKVAALKQRSANAARFSIERLKTQSFQRAFRATVAQRLRMRKK
jgi:hypothetical protein